MNSVLKTVMLRNPYRMGGFNIVVVNPPYAKTTPVNGENMVWIIVLPIYSIVLMNTWLEVDT